MIVPARILLSFVLVGSIVAFIGFQWNESHIFNPAWHPHARFHGVQLGFFLIALSLAGLYLLWRRVVKTSHSVRIAASVPLAFWMGEFIGLLVPGTHPSPTIDMPNTFDLLGFQIYGNLFFSFMMILFTLLACWLAFRGDRPVVRSSSKTSGK